MKDPHRRHIFMDGDGSSGTTPYEHRATAASFVNDRMRSCIAATDGRAHQDLSAYGVSVLLRTGKGAGNAVGSQQPHSDLSDTQIKAIGEVFSCIATAEKPSKLKVYTDTNEWVDIAIPPRSMLIFRGDLIHAGLEFEEDHEAIHFYIAGSALVPLLKKDPKYLRKVHFILYDEREVEGGCDSQPTKKRKLADGVNNSDRKRVMLTLKPRLYCIHCYDYSCVMLLALTLTRGDPTLTSHHITPHQT